MMANQSIGSFAEPLCLDIPAMSLPCRSSTADQGNPITFSSSSYSSSQHFGLNIHEDHKQYPSHHDGSSQMYAPNDQIAESTSPMTVSRSSSLSSTASRSTVSTTAITTAFLDAKRLHKHHKQEVVLGDGPSKRRYRYAALHPPHARSPVEREEEEASVISSTAVVGSGSGGRRGGDRRGDEDEEDRECGRGQRRRNQQPNPMSEQDGGAFKTMDKCSTATHRHRKQERRQGGVRSTLDVRAATSTEAFGDSVAMTAPKREGSGQVRRGQDRDYAESQQPQRSAVPPLSALHQDSPTTRSSHSSSFSPSSYPSSPIVTPISSVASPSMHFSLSTPSSPSSAPWFHLPPSSPTSATTVTAGASSVSSSFNSHQETSLLPPSPPLSSQQPLHSSLACSTTMPQLHPLTHQCSQDGQDLLVAPSFPPRSCQVAAAESKRGGRHGKQHSFSFRLPSRTKSLLSLVGRSRATTVTSGTLSQAKTTTVTDPSSTLSEYLSPLDSPLSSASKPTPQQSSSHQAYPQLPGADDLVASLAPRPQQLPQGRKNSRHRHQPSHSHSHSNPSSQPPIYPHSPHPPYHNHTHNINHNHSQHSQSALSDEFRIHHPRSASMSSSPFTPTMATAGPLLATTGSRADMGSPSSRHSIVFPLDGVSPSSPLPFSSTPRPAAIARTMTASRPAMDFELLQQQRLQQAAAALIATAAATAASSSASSPTSANEDGSSRRGGGRVLSSPSSSATSPCASSSSSMIITNTSSHHHHPTPAPLSSTSTTTAPSPSDPWRDQWLGPSGAMQSLFRDRPSKFNCPHCGARRVRSHIEFVPGVMSFLVSFGLLFLTVGTLSFLPFRKDHKATKDCVHWCPRCETRVARFVRASGTWEWM